MFIQFSEDDLNGVESLLMLGVLANNTFISIVQGAVSDSSGNLYNQFVMKMLYQLQYTQQYCTAVEFISI